MADNGAVPNANIEKWPLPGFTFRVVIEDIELFFREVYGAEMECDAIDVRMGDSPAINKQKMSGLKWLNEVTLKKGIFNGDECSLEWLSGIELDTIERKAVYISLLDERGHPTVTWNLANAWPKEFIIDDSDAGSGTIVIETLVLVHEGIVIM